MTLRWEYLMIHHSLTKDSGTVSWGAIRKYHTDPNGPYKMSAIGYHYGIELIGDPSAGSGQGHHEILGGRSLLEAGAHCYQAGMNSKAIGICVIGNFDAEVPSEGILHQGARLVKMLMEIFKIPVENVVPHSAYAPKSCPGKLFNMEKFRARIAGTEAIR